MYFRPGHANRWWGRFIWSIVIFLLVLVLVLVLLLRFCNFLERTQSYSSFSIHLHVTGVIGFVA
jgi:uncharacterized SAM-binding protein YcdF (DUF218 family)